MAYENSILYLYGVSLSRLDKGSNFLSIIQKQVDNGAQVAVVLIHDAVIGTSQRGKRFKMIDRLIELPIKLTAMKPDIQARGMDFNALYEEIRPIDYDELVDELILYKKIVSWL